MSQPTFTEAVTKVTQFLRDYESVWSELVVQIKLLLDKESLLLMPSCLSPDHLDLMESLFLELARDKARLR